MIRRFIIEAEDSLKGCDEAIEKLVREWGAEEIEPCEDCVSREEVITKIEDEDRLSFMGCFCSHDAAMGFRETIKGLPSVTPTIPEVENDYNIGYNCGYADAMSDVAEMRGEKDDLQGV